MRTRVFDICKGEYWTTPSTTTIDKEWQRSAKRLNYAELCEAARLASELDEEYAQTYLPTGLLSVEDYPVSDEIIAKVEANRYRSQLLLAPLRATDVRNIDPPDAGVTARTGSSEITLDRLYFDPDIEESQGVFFLPSNHSYTVKYRWELTNEDFAWIKCTSAMTPSEYMAFLRSTRAILAAEYGSPSYFDTGSREIYLTSVADAFYEDVKDAVDYKAKNSSSNMISANLSALSKEITKDCKTDYEKAYAIQKYFLLNDFTYDLKQTYSEGRRTADNFVFNVKAGVCTDFANAMTLMCRSVGLPARYVEGFMVTEQNAEGVFVVRDNDAHAFVEVYISGLGWTTFDPTVPAEEEEEEARLDTAALMRFLLTRGQIILIVIGALVVLYLAWLLLFPKLAELFFRISVKLGEPGKSSIAMYRRILKKLRNLSKEDITDITPQQTAEKYYALKNIHISPLITAFEIACYSEHTVSKEEFDAAYQCYIMCMKRRKKEKLKQSTPEQ